MQRTRTFVLPSHVLTWARVRRERRVRGAPDGLVAAVELDSLKAEQDGGRYLHRLVHLLEVGGYRVSFPDRFRFLAGLAGRRYKRLLLDHPFSVHESLRAFGEVEGGILLTDATSTTPPPEGWTRIDVSYEKRYAAGPDDLALPYGVHPHVAEVGPPPARRDAASGEGRSCRLFFGGHAQPGRYDRPDLGRHFGILDRVRVLDEARRAAGARYREGPPPGAGGVEAPFRGFHRTRGADVVGPARWLRALRRTEVFLACPGRTVPMAHGAVEAMRMGAVPFLQYPEYFDPPLQDGVDALVYRDAPDLRRRTREILDMPSDRIAALRAGAVAYYHEHLHPARVARLLADRVGRPHTTLLYNWFLTPGPPG